MRQAEEEAAEDELAVSPEEDFEQEAAEESKSESESTEEEEEEEEDARSGTSRPSLHLAPFTAAQRTIDPGQVGIGRDPEDEEEDEESPPKRARVIDPGQVGPCDGEDELAVFPEEEAAEESEPESNSESAEEEDFEPFRILGDPKFHDDLIRSIGDAPQRAKEVATRLHTALTNADMGDSSTHTILISNPGSRSRTKQACLEALSIKREYWKILPIWFKKTNFVEGKFFDGVEDDEDSEEDEDIVEVRRATTVMRESLTDHFALEFGSSDIEGLYCPGGLPPSVYGGRTEDNSIVAVVTIPFEG